jgi:putative flippase GtrA
MRNILLKVIDSGYFLVKRFIPIRTYRYALCGGGNLALDILLYFVFFHFIVQKQDIDFHFFVLSPHIASLFFIYPITLVSGFVLNRYIVFSDSELKVFTQLFRYTMVSVSSFLLSYVLMKFFVDFLEFYPTPSKILSTTVIVLFSYIMQNKFSFKV